MNIFFSELLGWNLISSRFLIGTYYGMLSTLPLGPSQLLSIRVLLLEEENKQDKMTGAGAAKGIFIAGVSGFLIAQFAMFMSIYYSSLYTVWFKPHVLNFLLPPFLLWHYLKIVEFDPVAHCIPNYKHPLLDPRVRTAFVESFLLQIINPVVLPNPVFTRLMSIYLFKYSHIPTFIFGSLIGWLSGQLIFITLSWILLSRLQSDSPSIYRIVKRIIHWAFPPIIMGILLSYMGRVSMVPFYKKKYKKKDILPYHLWPDICFNRDRISRSTHFMLSPHQSKLRNQTNAPFNTLNTPLHKNHFSQYFFSLCISDGKQRLSHNYPISISLIRNDLQNIINVSKDIDILEKEWITQREYRLYSLTKSLSLKLNNVDSKITNNLEKKINSISDNHLKLHNLYQFIKKNVDTSNKVSKSIRKYICANHFVNKRRIRKGYDARLNNSLRKQPGVMKDESSWLINQKEDTQISPIINRNYITRWNITSKRLHRLKRIISKLHIYNFYFDLYKKIPIWKNRAKSSSFYYEFEFFKKNLTRRRRRKFFVRSFITGSTSGRSRNIAGIFFQFLENKPRSSFFLRAQEFQIDSMQEQNQKQRISQTESEKFDFSSSHSVRGPALIAQAFLRKYIKLPTLILIKSLVRLILMQSSEWNQDWSEWAQEKYVYCYYNGNYVPDDQMPPHWLGDGLQIKILSPFRLTPWRPSTFKKKGGRQGVNIKPKFSYINIWGQETDVPFGIVQNIPFFQPFLKGLGLLGRLQLGRILRTCNSFVLKIQYQYISFSLISTKKIYTVDSGHRIQKSLITNINQQKIQKKDSISQITNELDKSNDVKKNKLGLEKTNLDVDIAKKLDTYSDLHDRLQYNQINDPLDTQSVFFKNRNKYFHNNNVQLYYSLVKKNTEFSVVENAGKKISRFPSHLIFKQTSQFFTYQKLKIQLIFIQLSQELHSYQKFIRDFLIELIHSIKKKQSEVKRITINMYLYNIIVINDFFVGFKRYLINRILNPIDLQVENSRSQFPLLGHLHLIDKKMNIDYLSNAYILHKIWQMNLINRLSIYQIHLDWTKDNLLNKHIQIFGNNYGLFKDKPENLNIDQFKEWLKPMRYYTPSPDVWNTISPNRWKNLVKEFWKRNSLFIKDYKYNKKVSLYKSTKYLSFYETLFAKNQKMLKRWGANLIIKNYTECLRNQHLNNFQAGWHNHYREDNQLAAFSVMKHHLSNKHAIPDSGLLKWGLSKSRANSLVSSFPLIKSFHGSVISQKNHYISDKQPIYMKYRNIPYMDDYDTLNLKKKVSFRPIIQYRWKSEEERFEVLNSIDLIKKAKADLKNAIKNAMLAKKHKLKSASSFTNKIQEATLRWKTLNLSPFTCQNIKTRQAKIVDDEILMHTIINSFLKFKKKYVLTQNVNVLNSSQVSSFITDKLVLNTMLVAEDVFLRHSLREYRILSCLNFSLKKEINKVSQSMDFNNKKNDCFNSTDISPHDKAQEICNKQFLYYIIQRYLWPTYRLEDLACMNRFSINTANQSRFSSLRIRIYPDLNT